MGADPGVVKVASLLAVTPESVVTTSW